MNNLNALKRHINIKHNEGRQYVQTRQNVPIQGNVTNTNVKQKLCAFYQQPRGCKKGLNCDFSNDANINQNPIVKVPKLCYNGLACTWKPRCRYVHPEDGEAIPTRAARGEGNQGVQGLQSNQDFVSPDISQVPPGYSLTNMRDFPGLPQSQVWRPSIFKMNPQFQ